MKKGYTDDWGYEVEIKDYSDWSDFEPWQYWSAQFDWQAETEVEEQDIIAFRDNVQQEQYDGSILFHKAARFIIARVAKITQDDFYLEVIQSEGKLALPPADKIKRKRSWVFKYGLYRWPRDGSPSENRPLRPTQRKTPVGTDGTPKSRPTGSGKNSKDGKSGRGGKGGCSSAFSKAAGRNKNAPPRNAHRLRLHLDNC